jgi:hypothetical protein
MARPRIGWMEAGEAELEPGEMDNFLPQNVNGTLGELEREGCDVLDCLKRPEFDGNQFLAASAQQRNEIESIRRHKFRLILGTLTDKYVNALNVNALLQKTKAGTSGFVLYLRGFSLKPIRYRHVTIGYENQDIEEYVAGIELAQRLAPTPLVLVRNPVSTKLITGGETYYPLDLDANWEADIRTWAGAASFVCVRNKLKPPGLLTEFTILQELGRLNETYFSHPEEARTLIANGPIHRLDEAAISHMRKSSDEAVRPLARLPMPTCLWLQGRRRETERAIALFIFDLFNVWADAGQKMFRDVQTRLMASAVAASMCLERLDFIAMALASYAQILSQYRSNELVDRDDFVRFYMSLVQSIAQAIDETPTPIFNYQDLNGMKMLSKSENPTDLIWCTMRCMAACSSALMRQIGWVEEGRISGSS